ncbi:MULTISPECIES: hydroxypyruvate isomerase family protein [Flectobacillus]|jgi:hydroxypyruvate isomerase|uniref:TIM barrel protein n=1 Tax=Flectobacillus roseus TaxID=502259 RepID=A0ABT6YD66_9BACT|nr:MULTISPECIES: TIM barrel protein [Flectobacillus]MDI9861524.1 TIM barrel protein [Flectobacillus roseus]MDI9868686.1 TIM barrel protein [Flectobacillus roseus]NBA77051.1 TIM barrel protein [Emticicia sp. ODNR4P]PAC32220.1 xylose isomerase [Flectobacillus sp. BAB-3569]
MQRRDFTKNLLAASAVSTLSSGVLEAKNTSAQPAFKLKYAPHFGMFENSAGKDPIDQLKFMHEMGFRALEDNGMMDRSVEVQTKVGETMAKLGMTMGVFVVNFDNWPLQTSLASGKKEWRDKFLQRCKEAVEVAKRVNAKWMTVVPGNYDRSIPIGIQTGHVIESLRMASAIFEPHGLVMVLEALSDTPDLFLRNSDQTYMICKAVNSPSCKFLFDMWHMQRNEGHIIYNIDQTWDEIGYFQIGDEPGRKEPTTGEMNYKNIFKHINAKSQATGRDFVFGMEHGNSVKGKEGEIKLIEAYRASDL